MDYSFSLRTIFSYLPALPDAIGKTLIIAVLITIVGIPIGGLFAVMRESKNPLFRLIGTMFVEGVRNTPAVIFLYFVFFVLPAVGLRLNPMISAVVALTVVGAAYKTEIFRAGFAAISAGQYDAAAAQGMTRWQTLRHVIFPQVGRVIYEPFGNHCVQMVHTSSLASIISVVEVTGWTQGTGAASFRFFEAFTVAVIVYVTICQGINLVRILFGWLMFRRYHFQSGARADGGVVHA